MSHLFNLPQVFWGSLGERTGRSRGAQFDGVDLSVGREVLRASAPLDGLRRCRARFFGRRQGPARGARDRATPALRMTAVRHPRFSRQPATWAA
jgi:hypothetical protein